MPGPARWPARLRALGLLAWVLALGSPARAPEQEVPAPPEEGGFVIRREPRGVVGGAGGLEAEAGVPAVPPRADAAPFGAETSAPHASPRSGAGVRSLTGGAACLGAVLLSIVLLAWLFRRFAPGAAATFRPPCLEVLGRTFLDRQRSVYLLRVGERVLVVGCSERGPLARLAEIDDPEEAERLCRTARGARGAPGLGRNPLALLSGKKSFLRSFREAAGGLEGSDGDADTGAPAHAGVVDAREGVRGGPPGGGGWPPGAGPAAVAALQGEALRLREQLEAMREAL